MTRSPIPKVLSTLRRHRVRALLMGGQACILYGGAEFSRDVDIAVAISPSNLDRLRRALADLGADQVYFPALSADALRRGHACHFRCRARGLQDIRLDVMAVMRGADSFDHLWNRRTWLHLPGVGVVAIMSLPDLVTIKKTQRDKDWPMIRRLVEADMAKASRTPTPSQVTFWLRECRTAELLLELARRYPSRTRAEARKRPLLLFAMEGNSTQVEKALEQEQNLERLRDREYWAPLRKELEKWRLQRIRP